jgi:sec-independent protein translocase protein TatC
LALASAAAWPWSANALAWLGRPAGGLVIIAPAEAFFARLEVSFFLASLAIAPLALFQAWSFAAEALGPGLRRTLAWALPASWALFMAGAAFGVFAAAPSALRFLAACGGPEVRAMISAQACVEFVAMFSLAFALAFQLPLILLALERAGLVTRSWLSRRRRWAILLAFVFGGVLSPGPDLFSQFCLAVPVVLLFELSLSLMRDKV